MKASRCFRLTFLFVSLTLTFSSPRIFAEENSGGFREKIREKIKERWLKKQQEKPAPESNSNADTKLTKAGDYTIAIDFQNRKRFYKVHVPQKYDPSKPVPLVLFLHGGGGDMNYQSDDSLYHQISKADQENFVAVFPNGFSKLNSGKLATWDAGKCCGGARDEKIDDVGFIKEVVNKVTKQLNIDSKKVFAAGMSNGGMMSYRLACELSDTFKAIASVAGTDNTESCTPKNPISILHIHAKNDDHVLFEGGAGKTFRDQSKVTDFTSVPATVSKWVKLNACNETPKRVLDKPGVYCDLYSQCKNKVEVQLCVTEKGGHSWPGSNKPREDESPSTAISGNDVIWDFFKSR